MPRLSSPVLAACLALTLAACASPAKNAASPADRLLMAAAGSYDNVKDRIERLPDGLRREIEWRSRPPVAARAVKVTYDEEQRPTSWRLDLTDAAGSLEELVGTRDVPNVGRSGEQDVHAVRGGPLRGSLALVSGDDVSLLSPAYVVNWQKDLLKFTRD